MAKVENDVDVCPTQDDRVKFSLNLILFEFSTDQWMYKSIAWPRCRL